MKKLLELLKKRTANPFYNRYETIHLAISWFQTSTEMNDQEKYSSAEVLELLELIALNPKEVKASD